MKSGLWIDLDKKDFELLSHCLDFYSWKGAATQEDLKRIDSLLSYFEDCVEEMEVK